MKTYHRDYGCSASITDTRSGEAKLIIRDHRGKVVHNKVHANRKAALAAWHRYCN